MALLIGPRKALLAGPAYDPDATSFFSRASITDTTQKNAVNRLAVDLKAGGIWTKLYAFYPFVGGNATAHGQNLVSSLYSITWNGTVTHNANGITGNGTTGYGVCTGLSGSTVVPHLGGLTVYLRTNNAQSSGATMTYCGIKKLDSSIIYMLDYTDIGGFEGNRGCMGLAAGFQSEGGVVQRAGCLSINRTTTANMKAYDDSTQYLSYTGADSSTPPAIDYYVLASNTEGVAQNLSAENLAMFSAHQGLTAAEVSTLTTAVATYQTALGRNV